MPESSLPENKTTATANQTQSGEQGENLQIKIATFNLFNYLEPPNAFYEFERIYSAQQWAKKQRWISDYLNEYHPDVIGFQEVFSPESLKTLVAEQGYPYFQVVGQPQVMDDFIYSSPVVAIAARYPIIDVAPVQPDCELAVTIGLKPDFSFSRKVLRAKIDLPHIGHCDCYVVHFKSKRPMIEFERSKQLSAEKNVVEQLKAQVAGGWGSTIQRGSEAALLYMDMIARREATGLPMILMGDFNNTLTDGVLGHLVTERLRTGSGVDRDRFLEKYRLKDSWTLFQATGALSDKNNMSKDNPVLRQPSHYYGAIHSVIDYILFSCEFDANCQNSLFELSDYHTYDRHLINPLFERDGESTDHGIIMVTLTLRS